MPRGERGSPPYSETLGHTIYVDFIGPVQGGRRGQKFICSIIDSCSRVALVWTSRKEDTQALIRALSQWRARHGPFKVLVLDNANYNSSYAIVRKGEEWGFELIYPPPYRHEAMGLVERFNATIVDRLRKLSLALGRNWTELVGQAINVYNMMWHDIIRAAPTQL